MNGGALNEGNYSGEKNFSAILSLYASEKIAENRVISTFHLL
jgi:hypothetical protein